MELIPLFISLLYLIKYSSEIIPNWNLDSSAIKLSFSSGSITYTLVDRDMYSMKVKLTKTITKSGNTITQTNYLSIGGGTSFPVQFENIESFYHLNGIDIICPKGKHHPYDATNKKDLIPDGFEAKGNWDLKCYKHNTNYLLVFYLLNGDKHFFGSPSQYNSMAFNWKTVNFASSQLFDFKLENGEAIKEGNDWKKYKLAALILEDGYLKLKSFMAEFHYHGDTDNLIYIFDSTSANPKSIDLIQTKRYTQAYFNNITNEFYFYTYNDISDFTSGYSTITTNDYGNIGNVQIHINNKSPFDFVDDAHILEMDFVLYNKYIYLYHIQ